MFKNKKYYYQIEKSESNYETIPSSMLSISQMLKQQPFWRQPFGKRLMKKKTFVIHASDIAKLKMPDYVVAAERLQAFQKQGFKIYFQKGSDFLELDTALLRSPKLWSDLDSQSDKEFSKLAAEKLKLSRDELFVINNQELDKIMQGDNEDWAEFDSLTTVDLHESNINVASLKALLKKSGSKIKSLNLSQCINLKQGTLPEDLALDALEELVIHNGDTDFEIPALGRGFILRLNNLDSLSIKHMLQAAPKLKVLKLGKCYDSNQDALDTLKFPSLEVLDLSNSQINSQALSKILANSPKLKELHLQNCKLEEMKQAFDDLNLSSLEVLDLSNTEINKTTLNKLLAKAPNLKVLKLNNPDKILDKIPLAHLKTLHILKPSSPKQLSPKVLSDIQLKELKLTGVDINDELLERMDLSALEHLDFIRM